MLQSTYLGILPGFINGTRWRRSARDRRKVQALGDVRHLATLMLNQGCRPEELRELPQAHVDLAKATLTIAKGKSDAARRSLPLTAESRFVLAARLSEPSRWVFPSRRGQGHIYQHQRLWESIIRRAQLEGLVMYDLRHTFATRAACSCLS